MWSLLGAEDGSFMTRVKALAGGLVLLGMFALAVGCGERPVAGTKAVTTKSAPAAAETSTPVAEPRVEYTSVPEALDAVERLSASGNASSQDLVQIEQWLGKQGDKAAPALSAALADSSESLAVRITACRALSKLGPQGKEPLLQAAAGEPRQLRLKATECLGRINPTDKAIVEKLVATLDADDFDQRKAALTALANIGPPASKAEPKLVEKLMSMLNDTKQDETLRGLANTALKKVDPRTGLQNAH
jgi:HEAT repeat protein